MGSQRRTRAQWRKLVSNWPGSGLSQEAYCRRHNISVASLHRWREILRHEGRIEQTPPGKSLQLLPVTFPESTGGMGPAICVVLDDGLRIELGADFQSATLRRVLDVLRPTP
jgi:transposase